MTSCIQLKHQSRWSEDNIHAFDPWCMKQRVFDAVWSISLPEMFWLKSCIDERISFRFIIVEERFHSERISSRFVIVEESFRLCQTVSRWEHLLVWIDFYYLFLRHEVALPWIESTWMNPWWWDFHPGESSSFFFSERRKKEYDSHSESLMIHSIFTWFSFLSYSHFHHQSTFFTSCSILSFLRLLSFSFIFFSLPLVLLSLFYE